MKKEETNDIVQYLLPILEDEGINQYFCKIDVTTEKSGQQRGDVWVSSEKQDSKGFEKNLVALIEAKHKNANIGDMDWRDAMRQGKEKATKEGLSYYIVTNCRDSFRFYNIHDDEEIVLDGKTIIKLVPLDILQKINTQVSKDNSHVIHKATEAIRPFSEDRFRVKLRQLADIYRSAGLKKGDERIDPTVSFVVIKYISENEKQKRTLSKVIKLWDDLRSVASDNEGDLKYKFDTIVKQIWDEESEYKENIYEDFKNLIYFSPKLKNEHFKKIFGLLDDRPLHGVNFDLFGVIYEEFASQTKKKEFGEFYTRRHITKMVSSLLLRNEITPRALKICDPASGSGGFLTEAYKVLETLYSENGKLNTSVIKDIKEKVFWGYDNDSKSVARTQINMFLVGDGHVHIYETDDSLMDWKPKNGWKPNEFDYILTNPPMGQYEGDAKIEDFKYTNEKRFELLFVEKVIEATKNGGGIGIVVNDGALETPSRANFRKKLLENCDIHAIVSITRFEFAPYTKEKTYILFMQKKQTENVGTIQNTPIWHFILDYDGYANSDKRYKTKYHDDIPEFEEKFEGATKLAKKYSHNIGRFEQERFKFEREVNDREKQEGLWGLKCGFVEINKINDDNFYNLLSEFHLRPIIKKTIDENEFEENLSEIILKINELKNNASDKIMNVFNGEKATLKDCFIIKGGNSGLTEDFIYNNQPSTEDEQISILSSATKKTNLMGYISNKATPDNKKLKVFSDECILVARNGYAGTMTYMNGVEFTTNDHAYVLIPKKEWKNKINLRWFAYQYQELFYNLVTSKSDNATFNKQYAEKQIIAIPDKDFQDKIAIKLLKMDYLFNEFDKLNGQINNSSISV